MLHKLYTLTIHEIVEIAASTRVLHIPLQPRLLTVRFPLYNNNNIMVKQSRLSMSGHCGGWGGVGCDRTMFKKKSTVIDLISE